MGGVYSVGAQLVQSVVDDMRDHGLEPTGKERELLCIAEKLADRQAKLERIVEADGMSYISKSRVHTCSRGRSSLD
jgi:hypothetical protein